MEQNQLNLSQFNINELKAYAYDEVVKINAASNNLKVLNQELAKRQQQGAVDAELVVAEPLNINIESYKHMEKKLSDLTVVELKSLAYDELARLEAAQSNLRVLNQEIGNRVQQTQQGSLTSAPDIQTNPAGSVSL